MDENKIADDIWGQNRRIKESIVEEEFMTSLEVIRSRACRNPEKENWSVRVNKKLYDIIMGD